MSDYYTLQQAAQTLGITESNILELQRKGLLHSTEKDGRSFLSSFGGHEKTKLICSKLCRKWNSTGLRRPARGRIRYGLGE